jgi:hypothetical protein
MKQFLRCNLLFLILINNMPAQTEPEVAANDTLFRLNPASVLVQSILVPGAGQVSQERLWTASIYYGVSLNYYLKTLNAYNKYRETSLKKDLNSVYNNLAIAGSIHLINVLDAFYYAYIKDTKGWDGEMFSDKPLKSPWGATLRSLMVPGWGQWYNESYLKSFAYIAAIALVGNEIFYNKRMLDKTGLEKYQDDYSRYSWYMGLTYLLMTMDAHVDAYLYKFDEIVDLTISHARQTPLLGIRINF